MVGTGRHPTASAPGLLALIAWSAYVLLAAFFYAPDFPPSALTIGACGILAILAVAVNFAYWRAAVALASIVFLVFYVVRVLRMAALTSGFELSALPSTLAFYYGASWQVTLGLLQERGVAGALAHGTIEYAMPVLSILLIALVWITRKR